MTWGSGQGDASTAWGSGSASLTSLRGGLGFVLSVNGSAVQAVRRQNIFDSVLRSWPEARLNPLR